MVVRFPGMLGVNVRVAPLAGTWPLYVTYVRMVVFSPGLSVVAEAVAVVFRKIVSMMFVFICAWPES